MKKKKTTTIVRKPLFIEDPNIEYEGDIKLADSIFIIFSNGICVQTKILIDFKRLNK